MGIADKKNNRGQSPINPKEVNWGLTPDASQVVVAYSGGLDSTVLLHLVKQAIDNWGQTPINHEKQLNRGPTPLAIHVNHNLSQNAHKWQTHCENVCKHWKIPFIAKSVHITSNDGGLEAQARKLRYAAIAECIEPNAVVLTGQHQQDQLETFLIQLKRGAGPKGLSCMGQSSDFDRQSTLLRPLLEFTRDELEQYALANKLEWIEDESNQDTRFDRNFIRHNVLPPIQSRWSGFGKAATRSIALIAEQQQLVDELARDDLKPLVLSDNCLDGAPLKALSKARQRNVLRYWFTAQNLALPSKVVLDEMLTQVVEAKPDSTPRVQWGEYQLRCFRQCIYVIHNCIELPGINREVSLNQSVTLNDRVGTICLSEKVTEGAMLIRPPESGDVITVRFNVKGLSCKPQGSAHTRKLKDLFKQHGVFPWQRSRTPLIYYGEQLVAVAGMFVVEGWAATPDEPSVALIFR